MAAVSDGYWLVGATGSTFTIPSTITPFQAARDAYLVHPEHERFKAGALPLVDNILIFDFEV